MPCGTDSRVARLYCFLRASVGCTERECCRFRVCARADSRRCCVLHYSDCTDRVLCLDCTNQILCFDCTDWILCFDCTDRIRQYSRLLSVCMATQPHMFTCQRVPCSRIFHEPMLAVPVSPDLSVRWRSCCLRVCMATETRTCV